MRVLLAQLASNGDCLFVTTIARQIKEVDYPNCHLTWLIGSIYRGAINNNPYIDEIVEIPITASTNILTERNLIRDYIAELEKTAHFDEIFVTDYTNENKHNWFGTTRSSLFRCYPHKLKVQIDPLIYLTREEVVRVKRFAEEKSLVGSQFTVLFECSPQSRQSNMTLERALHITNVITKRFPEVKVILSSRKGINCDHPNIIDGSQLSWRENAELTKYCHLLVGCSSGISWLNTSNWGAKIPMVQNINPHYMQGEFSASVEIDFRYFGMSTVDLLEIANADDEAMINCISAILNEGFSSAKKKYGMKHRLYYGGRAFLIDVLRNGSYKRGNLSNLYLLFLLIRGGIYSRLGRNKFARKLYEAGRSMFV